MHVNWLTVAFAVIVLWSIAFGIQRRFASESGHVITSLVSLAVSAVALWAAWVGSARLSNYAQNVQSAHLPKLLVQGVQLWQRSPGIAHAVAFFVVYLIVSGLLNRVLQGLALLIPSVIPGPIGRSRVLGGSLGAVSGAAHAVVFGALAFLLLQYLSVPALASMAKQSAPYQLLRTHAFEPYLRPLLNRDLPVYTQGALGPLAKNINMFAIPTGSGTERGVLVIPPQVSALATKMTAGQSTARDKAHALYEWEIHHIHYDWKKYDDYVYHGKWDQQSPLQTLQTGKGVCADYALLYADMAHSVGLTVQIDEGLGGTAGQYGSHAWNKVYIPATSQWITVDTTWGSQQDAWFNAPHFGKTHIQQTEILVSAASGTTH